jgi:hypothetical protein
MPTRRGMFHVKHGVQYADPDTWSRVGCIHSGPARTTSFRQTMLAWSSPDSRETRSFKRSDFIVRSVQRTCDRAQRAQPRFDRSRIDGSAVSPLEQDLVGGGATCPQDTRRLREDVEGLSIRWSTRPPPPAQTMVTQSARKAVRPSILDRQLWVGTRPAPPCVPHTIHAPTNRGPASHSVSRETSRSYRPTPHTSNNHRYRSAQSNAARSR